MKTLLTIFALLISIANVYAQDKPIIYNDVTQPTSEIDEDVTAHLSSKFTIVDIYDSKGYVPAKPIVGNLPATARTESGEKLSGYILVGYVVTAEGLVAEPFVIKTTENRLDTFAFNAMKDWRFVPAKLNGAAIATIAAQEFNFEAAPTDFVMQVLEPTGGRILRPKDWYYSESHNGPSYTWIISREEATKNPYTTGIRIQTLVDVRKGTGKNCKQFVLDFVAEKNKKAATIIKNCPEKDQGLFTRICLETEEGPYHILYSLFWGTNNLDIVVVSTAGTTKELWDIYSPTFDKMSAFELIDMKRFKK